MFTAPKLRPALLAAVTAAGVFDLRAAEAAAIARLTPCDDNAIEQAESYCRGSGTHPSNVMYVCNSDGSATILQVVCEP